MYSDFIFCNLYSQRVAQTYTPKTKSHMFHRLSHSGDPDGDFKGAEILMFIKSNLPIVFLLWLVPPCLKNSLSIPS